MFKPKWTQLLFNKRCCRYTGQAKSKVSWLDRRFFNFFKMGQPGLFSVYFRSFQTNINAIFTTNQCEKMSILYSLRCRDSNPRPLDHESSPTTTRPGLLLKYGAFLQVFKYPYRYTYIGICIPSANLTCKVSLIHIKIIQYFEATSLGKCNKCLIQVGALVQWLWEETHVLKLVGSYPSTEQWMDIFYIYLQ